METASDCQRFTVAPFTRLHEDGEVIVGRPEIGTFLVVEPSAVEVLDWLAEGATVGEIRHRYLQRYGEPPEIQPLLERLETDGFVQRESESDRPAEACGARPRGPTRFHLEWISPRLARRLLGPPTVTAMSLLVLAGLAALISTPEILPSWRALYFPEGLGAYGSILLLASLVLVAIHELAHLVAARAAGVSCRFGLGTRLWIPVAETDMTGVWSVPRGKRYLPLLAGPLADAAGGSVVALLLFASERSWIELPASVTRFCQALLLIYLLALLWQCYLFVRTDFYYVLANLLRCKNLMGDTEVFVRNAVFRWLPGAGTGDSPRLPRHEMRAVRWFSLAWLGGRIVAFGALLFIQLPLAWSYLELLAGAATGSGTVGARGPLATTALGLLVFSLGLTLWLFRLFRRKETS